MEVILYTAQAALPKHPLHISIVRKLREILFEGYKPQLAHKVHVVGNKVLHTSLAVSYKSGKAEAMVACYLL